MTGCIVTILVANTVSTLELNGKHLEPNSEHHGEINDDYPHGPYVGYPDGAIWWVS